MMAGDAPLEIGFVRAFYAVVWIGTDGRAAWVIVATRGTEQGPLIVADFATEPWSGGLLDQVMVRLDEFCEAARERNLHSGGHGVGAFWWGPRQLVEAAEGAMFKAFMPRLTAQPEARLRKFECEAIDAAYLSDPAGLALSAAAHTSAGRVKLGPAAVERSRGAPLLGSLSIRPGESVESDVLRLVVLLAIAIGLDPVPSHVSPVIASARVRFG